MSIASACLEPFFAPELPLVVADLLGRLARSENGSCDEPPVVLDLLLLERPTGAPEEVECE